MSVAVDPTNGQTSIPWIFAGGDVTNLGPKTVIEAIASGERAAVGIDKFLTGEEHAFWREEKTNSTLTIRMQIPVAYPRAKPPVMSLDRRINNFQEVEMAWTEPEAIRQAKRCLRCDYGKANN